MNVIYRSGGNALKVLEGFGDRYINEYEYLGQWKSKLDTLKRDWFQAFDFFLSHIYFQGRRDELSWRYYIASRKALLNYFGEEKYTQNRRYNDAWDSGFIPNNFNWKNWSATNNNLWTELEKAKAGKTRDIEMVLDSLRFIHSCPSKNIVSYSIEEIENGRAKKLYSEIDTIWQVGQKVTSFYLRDLVLCYGLRLSYEDNFTIQPIDTWVYQVVNRLGICSKEDLTIVAITKLLEACDKAKVDPKKVNAGAWYLGANAFSILLDYIKVGDNLS